MTEDQYQQIRQFVKIEGKYLEPKQLQQLKHILNDAKNIRNRIFFHKSKVMSATRVFERTDTLLTRTYLENTMNALREVKIEFSKFLFDTSNYSSYQTNINDKERKKCEDY